MELGVFSIVNMERHGKTNAVRSLYSPILQTERLFFLLTSVAVELGTA